MSNQASTVSGPKRSTERLHAGRISQEGACYFVTFVTASRKPWLAAEKPMRALLNVWTTTQDDGTHDILAATVLPDHVHVLFRLGHRLTVGQCVAEWKTHTRKAVGFEETFQRDFWEHRLRLGEDVEAYALYIFLNPYRAGLTVVGRSWPGWYSPNERLFRFGQALDSNGCPPAEWIDCSDETFSGLSIGE